jgi:hypothetical protein
MRVVRAMMLTAQFKGLDPVRLLQEIRLAQQTLSDLAAHGVHNEAAPGGASDVAVFLASLSSAWKDGEARPTRRQQPKVKHWWRNRPDPFADAWPVIEGWLIAEPSVSACALMDRLAAMVPDAYASKAQLRTLQRRVKAWRSQRVKEMVLGSLRKSSAMPAVRLAGHGHVDDAPAAHRLRAWTTRRCAAALPTAATFDHMPTAFDD